MATLPKRDYKDINDTLKEIKRQIIDGLPFALSKCPHFETPEELFYWLKKRITYKNDPEKVELLQMLPTLLTNRNYHGVPGAGDCDCFSIATITLMIAQNWDGIDVVLAGRKKIAPVHIYTRINFNGQYYILDLTNPTFNTERTYPFTQHIPVKWHNWTMQ